MQEEAQRQLRNAQRSGDEARAELQAAQAELRSAHSNLDSQAEQHATAARLLRQELEAAQTAKQVGAPGLRISGVP